MSGPSGNKFCPKLLIFIPTPSDFHLPFESKSSNFDIFFTVSDLSGIKFCPELLIFIPMPSDFHLPFESKNTNFDYLLHCPES